MADHPHRHKEAYEKLARDLPGEGVPITLTIHAYADGAMCVEGPFWDKEFCFKMLDEAREAIKRQGRTREQIVVPKEDVGFRWTPMTEAEIPPLPNGLRE